MLKILTKILTYLRLNWTQTQCTAKFVVHSQNVPKLVIIQANPSWNLWLNTNERMRMLSKYQIVCLRMIWFRNRNPQIRGKNHLGIYCTMPFMHHETKTRLNETSFISMFYSFEFLLHVQHVEFGSKLRRILFLL